MNEMMPAARAEAGPADAAKLSVEIVTDAAGLAALTPEWLALDRIAPGALVFQSAAWAHAIFAFEAARGNARFAPVVIALRRRGELVGVLPLERLRGGLRAALVPLGHAFAQYSDIALAPGIDPGAALALMLDAAAAAAPSDLVHFFKVRAESRLQAGLPPEARRGAGGSAPYVACTDFPDFEAYLRTVRLKTRKNMRHARNRLEREGPLAHAVAETVAERQGVIGRTLAGRADWLRELGLTSRAFSDRDFIGFCLSLAEPGPCRLDILALSLLHAGAPIAEQWGFVHNGRYYVYVTNRDFAQAEESPGKLHLRDVIEACFARGIRTVDMLYPAMPYKLTFSTGEMAVADMLLPLTGRGRITALAWDETLRPGLRRLLLALPPRLRQLLLRLARRS